MLKSKLTYLWNIQINAVWLIVTYCQFVIRAWFGFSYFKSYFRPRFGQFISTAPSSPRTATAPTWSSATSISRPSRRTHFVRGIIRTLLNINHKLLSLLLLLQKVQVSVWSQKPHHHEGRCHPGHLVDHHSHPVHVLPRRPRALLHQEENRRQHLQQLSGADQRERARGRGRGERRGPEPEEDQLDPNEGDQKSLRDRQGGRPADQVEDEREEAEGDHLWQARYAQLDWNLLSWSVVILAQIWLKAVWIKLWIWCNPRRSFNEEKGLNLEHHIELHIISQCSVNSSQSKVSQKAFELKFKSQYRSVRLAHIASIELSKKVPN